MGGDEGGGWVGNSGVGGGEGVVGRRGSGEEGCVHGGVCGQEGVVGKKGVGPRGGCGTSGVVRKRRRSIQY
jgi:hypothetical protein